jgi:hypothetical protein
MFMMTYSIPEGEEADSELVQIREGTELLRTYLTPPIAIGSDDQP